MWWLLASAALAADVAWYADTDGDGAGDGAVFVVAAEDSPPADHVRNADDCNDGTDLVGPDATEVCNGVDDNCDEVIDEQGCLCDVEMFDDHAYGFCNYATWWTSANGTCSAGGYHLVSLANATEHDYVHDEVRDRASNARWYVGLNDRQDEGVWRWTDGTPATYLPWDGGEPNDFGSGEDCVEIGLSDDNKHMNDVRCGAWRPFVCESEGAPRAWFSDVDGDGFGAADSVIYAHEQPDDTADNGADCDDDRPGVRPGVTEVCNGLDDDCDGAVDEAPAISSIWYEDTDGDQFGAGDPVVVCTPPGDGWVAVGGDCNDGNGAVFPGATEVCNGADDDCNGHEDDGATDTTAWYLDHDRDTWGAGDAVQACEAPTDHVSRDGDCDDDAVTVYPGAPELADGLDNDCNGFDENHDSDGDRLTDLREEELGTDPHDRDTDDDGVEDGDEVSDQTDPLDRDSDDDGLNDGEERDRQTNPLDPDSDDDGLLDGDEVDRETDPLDPDTDDGGVDDGEEVHAGTDPLDPSDDVRAPDDSSRVWVAPVDTDVRVRSGCTCSAAPGSGWPALWVLVAVAWPLRRSGRRPPTRR